MNTASTVEVELNLEAAQTNLVGLASNERLNRKVGRNSVHTTSPEFAGMEVGVPLILDYVTT